MKSDIFLIDEGKASHFCVFRLHYVSLCSGNGITNRDKSKIHVIKANHLTVCAQY